MFIKSSITLASLLFVANTVVADNHVTQNNELTFKPLTELPPRSRTQTLTQVAPVPVQTESNHQALLQNLRLKYPQHTKKPVLVIDISEQKMYEYHGNVLHAKYPVSTATNGMGSRRGSNRTPLGAHKVSERIGQGIPEGGIFVGRRYTGRQATLIKEPKNIAADAVTSRILWLSGLEPGKNKGGNVDSHNRYIYIHGTPEEGLIGRPASHGCIRMINKQVITLFNKIPVNTLVYIKA